MPVYTGVVYKRIIAQPDIHWSNTYNVSAANPANGLTIVEQIAQYEADVMYNLAAVYRIGVVGSDIPGAGGLYETVNYVGTVVPVGTDVLPLWNVAVVEFSSLGYRPSFKYLRLPLLEESVDGAYLTNGVITSLQLAYVTPMMGLAGFTNVQGLPFADGEVRTAVGMRQTDWNRRFRPGYHRGWIPNA